MNYKVDPNLYRYIYPYKEFIDLLLLFNNPLLYSITNTPSIIT